MLPQGHQIERCETALIHRNVVVKRQRTAYSTAARVTARGALKLPGRWADVPLKSKRNRWRCGTGLLHHQAGAVIQRQLMTGVLQARQQPLNTAGCLRNGRVICRFTRASPSRSTRCCSATIPA